MIFKKIWDDEDVKKIYEQKYSYQLPDNANYFLNHLERMGAIDYLPNDQDIILSRIKTSGIIETKVNVNGSYFIIVDVGGQRGERRKWALCFEDVTALLYCIALSEYNLKCAEDNKTNRMIESIQLFQDVNKIECFQDTPFIIFFNKSDILEQKIKENIHIRTLFPEYEGEENFKDYSDFIINLYVSNIDREKDFYMHVTNATDIDVMKVVWIAIYDIILRRAYKENGFL